MTLHSPDRTAPPVADLPIPPRKPPPPRKTAPLPLPAPVLEEPTTVTLSPQQVARPPLVRPRPYPNAPVWAITPGPDWPTSERHHPLRDVLPRRYLFGREIGRGGQGRILTVFDMDLGRPVALKTILAGPNAGDDTMRRFIHEVQITGQLEHPNIVPVHELGRLSSGDIFYTMKLVEGRTLAEVIAGLARGDANVHQEFGRVRLVTILQQICQGVSFAHARGVIHRDLKPSNIMLGHYGEVTIVDWGCAKVRHEGDTGSEPVRSIVTQPAQPGGDWTIMGAVQGTPSYMAPEQASGDLDRIDERTDIYALGAILYEILTYHPPFEGRDVAAKLDAVRNDPVTAPRQRAPDHDIPEELEDICMRCLAKDPELRFASAQTLTAALEAYLEGTLAQERRRREADEIARDGQALAAHYERLTRQVERLRAHARAQQSEIEPWEPIERKKALWKCIQKIDQVEIARITTFGEAAKVFNQALSHDPSNSLARASLARLYYSQFREAEATRDRNNLIYFEALVREFDDDGQFTEALRGEGVLTLISSPPGARVRLFRYQESGQRLKPALRRSLGETPISSLSLPQGSYLLVLSHAGYRETRAPLHLGRQQHLRLELRLTTPEELPLSYVHIPAGPFISGGDPRAAGSAEESTQWLSDFAISRFPVTCGEYLEFLNALSRTHPEEGQRRCPRLTGFQGYYWSVGEDGRYRMPEVDAFGYRWDPRWPVFGVSWEDANAYCEWRSLVEGHEVRLPTEVEWEKSARGVDGRYFPWGDTFDPTFCKMRDSREEAALPEPVGAFEADESPFGVRDTAGCIIEWCGDWYNPKQGLKLVKGGGWSSTQNKCRLASRHGEFARDVFHFVGFRTVRPLFRPR